MNGAGEQILELAIDTAGVLRFVYDDALASLLEQGETTVRRASHVEPGANGRSWTADLSPSGGPLLGPFPSRGAALLAEIEWIKERL